MWWELAAAGVKFTEAGHVITTQYNAHFGSTSKQSRVDIKKERWDKFSKYKEGDKEAKKEVIKIY